MLIRARYTVHYRAGRGGGKSRMLSPIKETQRREREDQRSGAVAAEEEQKEEGS